MMTCHHIIAARHTEIEARWRSPVGVAHGVPISSRGLFAGMSTTRMPFVAPHVNFTREPSRSFSAVPTLNRPSMSSSVCRPATSSGTCVKFGVRCG